MRIKQSRMTIFRTIDDYRIGSIAFFSPFEPFDIVLTSGVKLLAFSCVVSVSVDSIVLERLEEDVVVSCSDVEVVVFISLEVSFEDCVSLTGVVMIGLIVH